MENDDRGALQELVDAVHRTREALRAEQTRALLDRLEMQAGGMVPTAAGGPALTPRSWPGLPFGKAVETIMFNPYVAQWPVWQGFSGMQGGMPQYNPYYGQIPSGLSHAGVGAIGGYGVSPFASPIGFGMPQLASQYVPTPFGLRPASAAYTYGLVHAPESQAFPTANPLASGPFASPFFGYMPVMPQGAFVPGINHAGPTPVMQPVMQGWSMPQVPSWSVGQPPVGPAPQA